MTFLIEKSGRALRDLEEAFVYIAEDNLDAALRFLKASEESIGLLSENPMMGSKPHFEIPRLENLRMWQIKKFEEYLIFYVVESKKIRILRVIHAKRDFYLVLGD